jgi:hypothetical protein
MATHLMVSAAERPGQTTRDTRRGTESTRALTDGRTDLTSATPRLAHVTQPSREAVGCMPVAQRVQLTPPTEANAGPRAVQPMQE